MNSLFSPQPAPALHAQTWQLEYLAITNTDVIKQAEFRELYIIWLECSSLIPIIS